VTPADIVDWTFGSAHSFRQPIRRDLFGEPPVTVFEAPRFYIEALFWCSGTTSIHEHAFSGAFAVLAGSSVHSHWRFLPERTINSRMLCGRLERVSTEILRIGGVRRIRSGDRLIHQLFHLDLPSVTIVVRTYEERNRQPQYRYLPPGLAIDPEDGEGLRTRKLMFLRGMVRGQIDGLREKALQLVKTADVETVYYAFATMNTNKMDGALLAELYAVARTRHGEVVELFRQVCEGERRTRVATSLRSKVTDPEARFFLALLMLMPDREAIFDALQLQSSGAEPLATIDKLLASMSGKDTIGFEFDEINRLIFRGLVEGLDEERLLLRLRTEFRDDAVESHRERLLGQAKRLAHLTLFRPLLSRSPLLVEGPVS
jgi:hypothetical protein